MQSSFVGEKKKFSQDLKHSHHRVVRTSSSSRAVTQYSLRLLLARRKFGKSSSMWNNKKRFPPSQNWRRDVHMSEICIYNKCRKKNIGKANKKTTDKNFLPLSVCAFKKNKQFSHKKKRTSDAIILSTTHTQRQQQQQQEREERRLYNSRIIIKWRRHTARPGTPLEGTKNKAAREFLHRRKCGRN